MTNCKRSHDNIIIHITVISQRCDCFFRKFRHLEGVLGSPSKVLTLIAQLSVRVSLWCQRLFPLRLPPLLGFAFRFVVWTPQGHSRS